MRPRHFTLIEVVIALGVLALGILAATQFLGAAQNRCHRARQAWEEQHVMSQAAEFYLLASPDMPLENHIFPYRDYRVSAEYTVPGESILPPEFTDHNGNWRLVVLRLRLYRLQSGELLQTLEINRIVEDIRE